MSDFFGFVVLILFAGGMVGAMVLLSQWLGPRRRGRIHDTPFESGMIPREIMRGRYSVRFFLAALLFVLFDIELIFLYPWAVVFKGLGLAGFISMLIFLAVVLAGLVYSLKKGALEWK